jgi:sugar/nucleoside kinase (ribokinase family)
MVRPDVVVVGGAARDVADDDPRGWRLGGGVTYGALALARLGLRTGVVVGLDPEARDAHELELLRAAGAEVVPVPLERGPVFINEERPTGRVQTCLSVSDPVPTEALPDAWRDAPAWLLAPVAAEVPDTWADVPATAACVALGWQGLLRHLFPGERVWPIDPGPSPLLHRADIVGVSRHDLPHGLRFRQLASWLGDASELLFTAGPAGGLILRIERGRLIGGRRYPAVPSVEEVDPTGAGDTMLAGLLAARIADEGHVGRGRDLHVGALASALLVEGAGLGSVPWVRQLSNRRSGD